MHALTKEQSENQGVKKQTEVGRVLSGLRVEGTKDTFCLFGDGDSDEKKAGEGLQVCVFAWWMCVSFTYLQHIIEEDKQAVLSVRISFVFIFSFFFLFSLFF